MALYARQKRIFDVIQNRMQRQEDGTEFAESISDIGRGFKFANPDKGETKPKWGTKKKKEKRFTKNNDD